VLLFKAISEPLFVFGSDQVTHEQGKLKLQPLHQLCLTPWQYVVRRCFGKLIPTHGIADDSRPFRIFCDGLLPSNMVVNPKTMHITALLFEFANAMPAQFTYNLPWWLIRHPLRFRSPAIHSNFRFLTFSS
jgi:hypothetical protein